MAKDNGASQGQLVKDWAAAQAKYVEATTAAALAQAEAQKYAKAVFEAFKSEPFMVKSLGRSYRAIHKPAKPARVVNGKQREATEDHYAVIPVPENKPTRTF